MALKRIELLEIGKLPPQAVELEEAVIGACLLESIVTSEVISILQVESFYKDEHQKIFSAIKMLFDAGKNIDILTITEQLRKQKELDVCGGPAYLSDLTNRIASGAHAEYHARIVQQKFIQRELIRISSEIQNQAFDESIDVSELLDFAQTQLNNIVIKGINKLALRLHEIGKEVITELEIISQSDNQILGISSGFNCLDRMLSGWQNSDVIIIAARPSMGKTYLGLIFAMYAAKLKYPVCFFSIEMSRKQLYLRALSFETKIENGYFRTCNFTDNTWQQIEKAQSVFENTDLIIDDTASLSITEFRAKALLYQRQYGIKLIVIDYIQLMKAPGLKGNREQEISTISQCIKATAKELEIPIIVLAQLNRTVETRPNKRPLLSDLRESGAIEQDADIVLFPHRPEYYGIDQDENQQSTKNLLEIIIAKHRQGATGAIKLYKTDNWTELNEENNNPDF